MFWKDELSMEEEIFQLIPTLREKGKKAVRILPQQGDEPEVDKTKISGVFMWSQEEPWFKCSVPEQSLMNDYTSDDWNLESELSLQVWDLKHNDFFVPILQIRAEDIPLMNFPPYSNIFQLLWCPRYHKPDYSPVCQIAWRNEKSIQTQRQEMPKASYSENELTPKPCAVLLREIIDYPSFWALSSEEKNLLNEDNRKFYWKNLSARPGIKIGGYPAWIQRPVSPICDCGKEMEYFLTIDSDIFEDYPNHKTAGLLLGRSGSVYIFNCYECEGLPFRSVFQAG